MSYCLVHGKVVMKRHWYNKMTRPQKLGHAQRLGEPFPYQALYQMISIREHQEEDIKFTNHSTVEWLFVPLEAIGFFTVECRVIVSRS